MKALPRNALRSLNVLIVVGMLLGALAPMVEASSSVKAEVQDEARTEIASELSDVSHEVASQPAQSAPPFAPPLLFTRVQPERVAPGEVATISINLVGQGTETIADVVLTDTLPEGLTYVPGSATGDVTYSAQDNSLTWEVGDIWPAKVVQASFQVEVQGVEAGETATNLARLTNLARGEMTTKSTTIRVVSPVGDTAVVTSEWGGWLRSSDGRLEVDAPQGVVSDDIKLRYIALPATPQNIPNLLDVFFLKTIPGSQPDFEFTEPVELKYRFADILGDHSARDLVLLYDDENSGDWIEYPVILNQRKQTLVAYLLRPGRYAVVANEDEDFRQGVLTPSVLGFGTNLWTGDSSYSYPLSLPPAAAGTTPTMTLNYSSATVNDMLAAVPDWVSDVRPAQSGDFGLGWGLTGGGAITRGKDDTYYLSLPSGSFRLEHDSGANWKTVPESFLNIEHDIGSYSIGGGNLGNCPGGDVWIPMQATGMAPWTVRSPDGWVYQFGGDATEQYPDVTALLPKTGETAAYWRGNITCSTAGTAHLQAQRWNLLKVTPPIGDEWVYEYYGDTKELKRSTSYENKLCEVVPKTNGGTSYPRDAYVRHTRLKTITYGDNHYQVEPQYFLDSNRDMPTGLDEDDINCRSQWLYSKDTVDGVVIRADDSASQNWTDLRYYDLTTGKTNFDFMQLLEITEKAGVDPGSEQLPTTVFTYTTDVDGAHLAEAMRSVDNSHGATVALAHEHIPCNGTLVCPSESGAPNNGRLAVTKRSVSAMPNVVESVQTYDYTRGMYWPQAEDVWQFWGFGVVTDTLKAAETSPILRTTETRFNQTDEELKGQRDEATVRDGNGVELQRTENTWTFPTVEPVFARLDRTETYQDGQPILRQNLQYNTYFQGDEQFGNLTDVVDVPWDANTGDWSATPYRSTYTMYYPNKIGGVETCFAAQSDIYMTNKPGQVHTYQQNTSGSMVRQTFNYYDNNPSYTEPPCRGLTTRQTVGLGSIWQSTDIEYKFNGNPYKVTDANGHSSETYFDSAFEAYPVCTVNAKGDSVVRRYYGVPGSVDTECSTNAGSPVNNAVGHVFGQVEDVTDANDAVTSSIYDVWGRVTKVWRPGEDKATDAATDEVRYTDFSSSTAPTLVHVLQRDDTGGANPVPSYLENWQFHDGLGRVIQTQSEYQGTMRSLVDQTYGPNGSVASTTVPYSKVITGDNYYPSDTSQPTTRYNYDALGRSTVVTNPNNTTMRSFYNYLSSAVIDGNQHQAITESDAFGRLIRSNQYEDEYTTPNWTIEPYFYADYTYDVLNNLRFVIDKADKTTEMQYDVLNRKVYMDDPNMGVWIYGYDAVGNLNKQVDAKEQRTCFYNDELDRLKGKTYHTGVADCSADPGYGGYITKYYYDGEYPSVEGAPQPQGKVIGKRTAMLWDEDDWTVYHYADDRGRLMQEQTRIDNSWYTTSYDFDALNRLTTMTYPDTGTETVTNTYNQQGLLNSMVGLQPYVESSSYDETGRLTGRLQRNNDIAWNTTYTFYPWNDLNLGRLQSTTAITTTGTITESVQDLNYTYDPVGNVTSIVDGEAGQTQHFVYDDLDRLTNASDAYDEAYEYYRGGNIERKGEPGNSSDGLYAYDDDNHVHAAISYRGNTYGYDANGNMTSRMVDGISYTLTYDAENRLIGVAGDGSTTTFTYDGDGNRVKKDEGGVVTHYPGRHYESTIDSGNTKYYFADGQLVTFERSPEYVDNYGRRFVLRDHLGSTSVLFNGRGEQLWEDRFLPYGDVRYTSKSDSDMPVQTQYRYTSQWFEDGLGATSPVGGLDRGLYYYGARWYDSYLNRWIQPDTVIPDPSDPQSLNRYTYAANNPLKYTDPSGHVPIPLIIAGAIIVAKAIDYGWTAYDSYQSLKVINDPNASEAAKTAAASNLAMAAAFELAEPDELLPISLPIDDLARKGIIKLGGEVSEGAARQGFRSFTRRNFRENLRRSTGRTAEDILGQEAHHVLPHKFKREFGELQLDVNDPIFGSWIEAAPHRQLSYEYNQKWQRFLQNNPSNEEVLRFAQELAQEYGFDVHFEFP